MPTDRTRNGWGRWCRSPRCAMAVALLLGAGLWWPAAREARELGERIEEAKYQLHEASRTTREMAELTSAMTAMDEEISSGGKVIPEQGRLADLLRELGTRIEHSGLQSSTIAGRPLEPGDEYATMPVEIAFRGSSLDTFSFIHGVERMERLMQVKRLRLIAADADRVEATLRLHTFFHDHPEGR